ncbi:hypothetical protein SXIM_24620 [Streptomyces xiamenensis]|uniref:Uncharacterized protein n=1 Tax=Streptomyces xiamenensis TaxID=408015 RepID=A0A0F7CP10_9ACTN|nr:hypothetical protein [Streptomyces xiamenensis]AKG43846.1 hypothetical protein SXIM_24620 [Streptomyces xiamenensis]
MDVPREVRIEQALTRGLPRLSKRVLLHLLAMHVSGFVLLASFLVLPPAWETQAYGVIDPPALVILAGIAMVVICHVTVQLPAALLGTLVHRRAAGRAYATTMAAAGVLAALLTWSFAGTWADWLDIVLRLALSLACYVALALVR